MFEQLTDRPCVLVTGPQRSGTRIATKIIAADLGYAYIDEQEYGVYDRPHFERLALTATKESPVAIHCPAMFPSALSMPRHNQNVVTAYVYRPAEDVYRSRDRIGFYNYGEDVMCAILEIPGGSNTYETMLERWNARPADDEAYKTIYYEELTSHRLWVRDRENWHADQTEP